MKGSIEGVVTAISEDEGWQGNLTDLERARALLWAEEMMTSMLESAELMVRKRLRQLNFILATGNIVDRQAVIGVILGE